MKTFVKPTAVALAMLLGTGLVACGDDDDETASDGGDESDSGEYCTLAAEMDEQEGLPTVEQLEALRDAAPDEISENVDFLADNFIDAIEAGNPSAAFEVEGLEEALGEVEAYEADACGIGGDEDEGPEQDASATELDPDATRVDVSATEYDFDFEAPSPGRVSFVMTNDGEEPHFMLIGKLAEGATLEEALASEDPEEEGLLDPDFTDLESDIAGPGEEAVLTGDFEAGDYAMLCFLPGPDGQPHAFSGMAVPFTVG